MGEEEIQRGTAITTAEYNKLKKKADILDFLFGEKGVRTENLMKLQTWRKKAELWDQYAIYDNDKEEEILVKDLLTAYEKLESVREFVLIRRDDIEKNLENFGILKPVLSHFLEETEGERARC